MTKAITPELEKQLEAINTNWTEFKARNENTINDLSERIDDLETRAARPGGPAGNPQGGGLSVDVRKDFHDFLKTGNPASLNVKAMSTGSDPDGGFAVPEQIDSVIANVLRDMSPMRSISNVVQTQTQDYKKLVNLHGTGTGWVGETDARPETGSPKLAEITVPTGEIYAAPQATQWMLEDAFFDVETWLREDIATAFSEMEGAAFVSGDGTKKPQGFLDYPLSTNGDDTRTFGELQYNLATGTAGKLDQPDDLLDLVYTLKPAYRAGAVWLMNDATIGAVRKLKDADGNYLWQRGLSAGQPDILAGYPVVPCADMPDVAANANAVAFGNFQRGYLIADRVTTLLRDPFTSKPFTVFYARKRVSGAVVDSNAIKVLKINAS